MSLIVRGFIQAVHAATSRTRLYQAVYRTVDPLVPLLRKAFPTRVTPAEQLGRAMRRVVRRAEARAGEPGHCRVGDVFAEFGGGTGSRLRCSPPCPTLQSSPPRSTSSPRGTSSPAPSW
jgi:hypothetical protein